MYKNKLWYVGRYYYLFERIFFISLLFINFIMLYVTVSNYQFSYLIRNIKKNYNSNGQIVTDLYRTFSELSQCPLYVRYRYYIYIYIYIYIIPMFNGADCGQYIIVPSI